MSHPELILYRETAQRSFPLILVVAREPNTPEPVVPGLGLYDFDEFPRCALWNASYGITAWANDIATRDLKDRCRERAASPLMYADCSPVSIENAVADKRSLRVQVGPEVARRHIESVFSHRAIIERTALVFLSGVDAPEFEAARNAVLERCKARGIHVERVPFFYGTNMPRIRETITDRGVNLLRDIYSTFAVAPALTA